MGPLFDAILSHSATPGSTIATLILFILPGFVAFKIDQQLRPQVVRNAIDALLEIAAYSIVNDLLWSIVYPMNTEHGFPSTFPTWLFAIGVFLVSPAVLTWGYNRLVTLAADRAWIPSPVARPWDHFFQRVVKEHKNDPIAVIATLRDGRRIGGLYCRPGFASSFPTDEQLLLGETWTVGPDGALLERVVGSLGLLIDWSDILTLEFLEWPPRPRETSNG